MKRYSVTKNIPESAIISIYSNGDIPCRLFQNKNIKYVAKWCFDDLTDDRGITQEQANQIASFVKRHKEINTMVVHCDAGISRSAGIAAAISKWYFGTDEWVFNSDLYVPNMRCYDFMIKAFIFEHI